jgi:hypothetical protein
MFVGMDVHKEPIDISLAEEGRDGEVAEVGDIRRFEHPRQLMALIRVRSRSSRSGGGSSSRRHSDSHALDLVTCWMIELGLACLSRTEPTAT